MDREVDVVFDGVGGAIGTAALARVRRGGRFFAYGSAAGEFVDEAGAGDRGVEVIGLHEDFPVEAMRAASARALELLADGTITPVIGQALPLERAAQAHAALAERQVLGKTVLIP